VIVGREPIAAWVFTGMAGRRGGHDVVRKTGLVDFCEAQRDPPHCVLCRRLVMTRSSEVWNVVSRSEANNADMGSDEKNCAGVIPESQHLAS